MWLLCCKMYLADLKNPKNPQPHQLAKFKFFDWLILVMKLKKEKEKFIK